MTFRTFTVAAAAALFLAALVGCSTGSTPPNAESTPTTTDSTPPKNAQQIVAELTAKVPGTKAGRIITAQNDPNHLLGRPGQYTSAAVIIDPRLSAGDRGKDPLSIDNGAKVEVFADEAAAKSRADYIGGLAKATPLAAEYDYQAGTTVVRVSKNLTPDQAAQYQQALGG